MDNSVVKVLEYNTNQKKLKLPEYGRNIQKMVDYAIKLEDKDQRNRISRAIITVMGSINPHLRDIDENKHKLWEHLAMISDYKLDIDSPYPSPKPKVIDEKPNKVPYKTNKIHFKHYGRTIELLINKAVDIKDKEKRDNLVKIIANQMKKLFLTWNKESVNDELIFQSLIMLSGNKISIPDGIKLMDTKIIMAKNTRKKRPGKYPHHDKKR